MFAGVSTSAVSSPANSSAAAKTCFNPECLSLKSERLRRRGWRLRNGEVAELCDHCASAYEEGKFCETFHKCSSGWRCCKSCGKRVHCGCIVSSDAFVPLDAGGIECMLCARKNAPLTPNPVGKSSFFLPVPLSDQLREQPIRSWNQVAGSGSVGHWEQAANLFHSSVVHSDMQSRMHFEISSDRIASFSKGRNKNQKISDILTNGGLKGHVSEKLAHGKTVLNFEEQSGLCVTDRLHPSSIQNEPCTQQINFAFNSKSANQLDCQPRVSGIHSQHHISPAVLGKQLIGSPYNGEVSSGETHLLNASPSSNLHAHNQLLPRFRPRVSDHQLQQASGKYPVGGPGTQPPFRLAPLRGKDVYIPPHPRSCICRSPSGTSSNSVITPLFEKMLSVSDAGRVGRLVLPKKCAEMYFPAISQPEGLPLKVRDVKGQEWIFQFRFWLNNNSRMYVLEGITPCIQSMQLQAGDVVTFSRLEPEGKLLMGFRKASTAPPSDQVAQPVKSGNSKSPQGAAPNADEPHTNCHSKGSKGPESLSKRESASVADPGIEWSKVDKSGYIAKEALRTKTSVPIKRKNGVSGSKSKRLKADNVVDFIELKVTIEEAQGLFRSQDNHVPHVVLIEDFEFEEFEEAPVIGRPTIATEDSEGDTILWAQCDDCLQWRKLPSDALLPLRWTCSKNLWDPHRSSCTAAQELTTDQFEDMVSAKGPAPSKKPKLPKPDPDVPEALEALASLAIQGDSEASTSSEQATTKHPRHRPGCSCIVCIQPPSGKGPKHHQTCTCNVCVMVQRRFQTLMLRRERKQLERETESPKFQENLPSPEKPGDQNLVSFEGSENEPSRKCANSCLKGQIDLNIQPEREEETSPRSSSEATIRALQDASGRDIEQRNISNTGGSDRDKSSNDIEPRNHDNDANEDHPPLLPINPSTPSSSVTR